MKPSSDRGVEVRCIECQRMQKLVLRDYDVIRARMLAGLLDGSGYAVPTFCWFDAAHPNPHHEEAEDDPDVIPVGRGT